MSLLSAEVRKLVTLPSVQWTVAAGVVCVPAMAAALSRTLRTAIESEPGADPGSVTLGTLSLSTAGAGELTTGLIVAIVIGVVAVSNEYSRSPAIRGGGRQVTTSVVAAGGRARLAAAKAAALLVVVTVVAAAIADATLLVAHVLLGPYAAVVHPPWAATVAGTTLAWGGAAMIAMGLTWCTRSGVIPLVLLLANASVVSTGRLVTMVSDVGYYLPDSLALALTGGAGDGGLPSRPVAAAAMLGWALVAGGMGALVLGRRDV